MDPEALYTQEQERLRQLEGNPLKLELPQAPRMSFLDHAAPYLARGLSRFGPAVQPGAGHTAANIASVLAQGFLGGRASVSERMFEDYDRRRAEAMARHKEATGKRESEVKDQREGVRRAASDLAKWRTESGVITDEMVPFAGGRKAGDRVPISTFNAAMNDLNKSKEPKPPKEADQGPWVTVQTPAGPKLMRAAQAAARGFVPTSPRETRTPNASEREQLTADFGLLDQIGRVRQSFRPDFVGPLAGRQSGVKQRVGLPLRAGETGFRSALAAIRNQVLKLRSGGAVTDGEAARLLEELPTAENTPADFEAKINEFERTYRTIATARRENMSGTGLDLSRIPPLPGGMYQDFLRGR